MSTYDAYNLSLRDSTEFTVPTGGSGGDSDFTTAQLTVTNTTDYTISAIGPCIDNVALGAPAIAPIADIQSGETITLTVVMHKGCCAFVITGGGKAGLEYEYEGDVESVVLPDGNYHVITGDATITVYG